MSRTAFRNALVAAQAALLAAAFAPGQAAAAQAAPTPAPSPKAGALIDLTGVWVSVVTEDWRWRMVTPPKVDFPGLPLNAAGLAAANAWDTATDGSCKAYGVGGLMRMPTRLRIAWEGEDTLRIEADAGAQTRRLAFGRRADAAAPRTLQGVSLAQWERPHPVPEQAAPKGGSLKVVTTNTTGGWVRRNGVPYTAAAVVTEHFDRMRTPDGAEWLTILTIVDDPAVFTTPMLTSSHFKREPDDAKWKIRPCRAD
jgi:hypothetical protein